MECRLRFSRIERVPNVSWEALPTVRKIPDKQQKRAEGLRFPLLRAFRNQKIAALIYIISAGTLFLTRFHPGLTPE